MIHHLFPTSFVHRVCRPALRGVNERLSYSPGAGQRALLGDHAHIDLCQEHACEVDKLTAYIQLETKHIGKVSFLPLTALLLVSRWRASQANGVHV